MKTLAVCAISIVLAVALSSTATAHAQHQYPPRSVGHDVSWPNCEAEPPKGAPFGIVGVTGGLVFRPNPCLFDEAHWFTNLSLYVNTGYKKSLALQYHDFPRDCRLSDEQCLAYNLGYNAGVYAVNYAASQYVHAQTWWLDVEIDNSWSTEVAYNRASLQGTVDAIRHHILLPTIGFYAFPGQWQTITGGWRNHFPAWAATGTADHYVAVLQCAAPSFTGGPVWLTQYTPRLDNNYVCPR